MRVQRASGNDGLLGRIRSKLRVRQRLQYLSRVPGVLAAKRRERQVLSGPHAELAICAIFREEARHLDEWIRFHRGVGVSKFYLYNNFSTDNFTDVLAPYVQSGLVEITDWPVPVGQVAAYNHCVRAHAGEARWIALIDVDEFLFSPAQIDIRPILESYSDLPGLLVYSPYFGCGGHRVLPPGPMIATLTRRAPLSRFTAKTIVNPRLVLKCDVHLSTYLRGDARGTDRRRISENAMLILDRLRLNHYWSRSLSDLDIKIARGDASTPDKRDPAWHYDFEAKLNAEDDGSILPIAKWVFSQQIDWSNNPSAPMLTEAV